MKPELIFLLIAASLVAALEECVREGQEIAAQRDEMIAQNKRLMALLARQNEALKLSRELFPSELRPNRPPN